MEVYQIRVKVYLKKDIPVTNAQAQITYFVDGCFAKDEGFKQFHNENRYKYYCYDLLYPQEADKIYKKDKIYALTIRTVDSQLAAYFSETCANIDTEFMKGLKVENRVLPRKHLDIIYTLTPAIIKDEKGYWKGHMAFEEYEQRLKVNLIKKWNQFENEKLDEDFELYTGIEMLNHAPIAAEYKGIKLLGDKLRLHVAENETAQKLAYMALGTGVLEMNSRGFGFLNYRWL